MKEFFHGMGENVWLIIRRDRLRLSIWVLALVLLTVIIAFAYTQLVPTEEERMVMAETMSNPAVIAMFGPGYGLDHYNYGAIMAHQMLLFTALLVAIMSILLVARHTRGDEENGRIEMIRSFPVGRLANLSAIILVFAMVNVLIFVLTGLGLFSTGIESIDLQGSMLYGAVLGVTGLFFTVITALFAQLAESSRGTLGVSFAFLGLMYLIRGIGDVGNGVLSWFSPLGWVLRSEVFVSNIWWPVLLTLGGAVAITYFAFYLHSMRDLEAGLIPARPGRKNASVFLQGPLGLAVKLQRTAILGWMFAMFILGVSYGSVLGDLETYLEAMELIQTMLMDVEGFSMTEQFLPMLMSVMSMLGTIPALLMIMKVHGEEIKSRSEHLLARSVSRFRLLGSYLFVSILLGLLVHFLAAFGLWSAGTAVLDEPISFLNILKAMMVYVPAMMTLIGIAVLFLGFLPGKIVLAWIYLGFSFFVVYLGGIMQLPQWLMHLSPFGHIPKYPVEEITVSVMVILLLLSLLLMAGGFWGYKQRDIQG